MLHGPLAGKIILFALPLAASSILQQLFNAADLAVVGRFTNARAMAAVGSNASVISLLINLFVGLSVGANVVIGNLVGSGRRKEVSDAVHTIITIALIAGVCLTFLGMFVAKPILTLMGAPQEVMDLAILYLRVYFLGMPAFLTYNYGSAILRSRGDSRRPFISLTAAGILNVFLNLLFVVVFHLHVVGVALATVLSNCLNAGMTLRFLMTEEDEDFRLDLKKLRIVPRHLADVLRIGLPAGIQGTVFSISNVVVQTQINSFGADCIADMTAAQNLDFISFCMISGFSQAAVTFTSQNYGAGNAERCRRVLLECMGIGLAFDITLLAVIVLARYQLIGIFTTDPAVIEYAMVRVKYTVAVHFLIATYEITGGALRGMNRSAVPALISVLGTCAFRLLYAFFFFPAHRTLPVLMLIYPLSWILTGAAMNIAYYKVSKKVLAAFPDAEAA